VSNPAKLLLAGPSPKLWELSSARNRGKFRMELPSSRKPTFGVCGSASVRFISERMGSIDSDAFFPCFMGSSEILYLPHILSAGDLCYG
jgi:hypothetical protein